jgi:hypothetical protein
LYGLLLFLWIFGIVCGDMIYFCTKKNLATLVSNYRKAVCPNLFAVLPNIFIIKILPFLLKFGDVIFEVSFHLKVVFKRYKILFLS